EDSDSDSDRLMKRTAVSTQGVHNIYEPIDDSITDSDSLEAAYEESETDSEADEEDDGEETDAAFLKEKTRLQVWKELAPQIPQKTEKSKTSNSTTKETPLKRKNGEKKKDGMKSSRDSMDEKTSETKRLGRYDSKIKSDGKSDFRYTETTNGQRATPARKATKIRPRLKTNKEENQERQTPTTASLRENSRDFQPAKTTQNQHARATDTVEPGDRHFTALDSSKSSSNFGENSNHGRKHTST